MLSIRGLRANPSDILGRTSCDGERVGVTKNGRLAATVVDIDDLSALEELKDTRDLVASHEAACNGNGRRINLTDLRAELDA